jgi:hypothetical protein
MIEKMRRLVVAAGFLLLVCAWSVFEYLDLGSSNTASVIHATAWVPKPSQDRERSHDRSDKVPDVSTRPIQRAPGMRGTERSSRSEALNTLYLGATASKVEEAAFALERYDADAIMHRMESDGFCATFLEPASGRNFDALVADGMVDTPAKRQSFNYLVSVAQRYCDPGHDYFQDVRQLAQDALALPVEGSTDYKILQSASALSPDQRGKYAADVYDIMLHTDSPFMFREAATMLLGSNSGIDLGNSVAEGTGLESKLPEIDRVAANLAYCQMAGYCNFPDAPDVLTSCAQQALCHPGMTYWIFLQETTPPLEFEMAQQIAQRLLRARANG